MWTASAAVTFRKRSSITSSGLGVEGLNQNDDIDDAMGGGDLELKL